MHGTAYSRLNWLDVFEDANSYGVGLAKSSYSSTLSFSSTDTVTPFFTTNTTPAVDLTFKYKYAYHQAQLRNESWAGIFDGVQAQCGVKFGAGGMLEVNMTNFAVR